MKEIEFEYIELTAYENLCDLVGIEPVIEIIPGRDYEENGELCSWYEDKVYPDFTKGIQEKLLNYIMETKEASALISYIASVLIKLGKIKKETVKQIIEGKYK